MSKESKWLELLQGVDHRISENNYDLANDILDHMPFPCWYKTAKSKMLYINQAYVDQWHITREQYVNKYDIEVWGKETGMVFVRNDQSAIKSGGHWTGYEYCPDFPLDPKVTTGREWWIRKWPIYNPKKLIIAIAGIAMEKSWEG